ncbi:D-2-hydroxyacid dehydrogenase [[Kitasatospora] papulosa]|uniref:D-isomer specific 2-hydroxyacid dehydrogenase NAD-binding protein n=1 Tax=Streptomyces pratensis (strain ATCC 33331 / IAF-45CD) TaxID=591167 RepID=A0A8D4BGW5_STRFA|nr:MULTISPECIES: D-2-hydroxyacid dehydrogenase [Streptomyces]RAS36238.1 phosphoglycerate dehydrogenase-like enzyme [Streptomyces avidinii]SNX71944.1 Phosphoglycerate dehydrogenase [Streptomyces microflavus]MDX3182547.1 D-2-hydroxyacid dehydrogenase [Streptomyces sp. ME02-7008A-1]MDX3303000.1 D-2-hydroxyacid dehydrogenase [Streptomyces sp. ME02-7008A]MYT52866.1 D-2-hydroxyacid dehydrogenase [Streptomyces sp. SID7815]
MTTPVILVLEADPPPRLGRLAGRAVVRYADRRTLAGLLPGADVLLVWDFTSDAVREAWPGDGPRPRWVHTASAGVDRLLCPELAASPTVVTNARGVFELPIAEYVAGLVLAFAKDLPRTLELQRLHRWSHRETRGLAGTRAVVVGAGPVGREIMRLLDALGVQVALVGRTARRTIHGVEDLDRLAAGADWVIGAAPLTDATRGMFDSRFFGLLQPSAHFVNVGRGALTVEEDLAEALRRRWIAGAALDVFQEEPLGSRSPLWEVPRLLVSPHMSGDTAGWRDRLGAQFVSMYELWSAGEPLPNVVDIRRGYVPSTDIPD